METLSLLRLEFLKNRRKKTFLLVAAMFLIEVLFLAMSQIRINYEAKTWLVMFFNLPILNSIFIPVMMAVLASKNIDIENKGEVWKLLYTFDNQMRFFWTKLLYGFISILCAISIQVVFALISGTLQGMTDFRFAWLAAYFGNTVLAASVLYLFQLILSFGFRNQTIGLSVGLLSGFLGIFIMFLPKKFMKVLPMGIFGYTDFAMSDWDLESRISTIYEQWPALTDYIPAFLWLGVLLLAAYLLFRSEESEENALGSLISRLFSSKNSRKSDGRFGSRLPEMMKLRGSIAWLPFVLLPVLSALIGTFNYWQNSDVLTDGWYSLWSQHTLFLCYFFFPASVAVACSILCRFEHKGTNWNQILTCTTPGRIVLEKTLSAVVISACGILWIGILFLVGGKIVGIEGLPPLKTLEWLACGMSATLPLSALHIWIGLKIRNLAVPVGIAVAGGIAGLVFTQMEVPYFFPYSLFCVGMRANNPEMSISGTMFIIFSVVFTVIFTLASIWHIRRTDVRTNN